MGVMRLVEVGPGGSNFFRDAEYKLVKSEVESAVTKIIDSDEMKAILLAESGVIRSFALDLESTLTQINLSPNLQGEIDIPISLLESQSCMYILQKILTTVGIFPPSPRLSSVTFRIDPRGKRLNETGINAIKKLRDDGFTIQLKESESEIREQAGTMEINEDSNTVRILKEGTSWVRPRKNITKLDIPISDKLKLFIQNYLEDRKAHNTKNRNSLPEWLGVNLRSLVTFAYVGFIRFLSLDIGESLQSATK